MQSTRPPGACLLVVAGPICAGKTTLARLLSERLGWSAVKVSSLIAKVAVDRGLSPTRDVLQAVGLELVRSGGAELARLALSDSGWSAGSAVIVDGIRQVGLYTSLSALVAPLPSRMLYLDAPFEVRAGRAEGRDRISPDDLRRQDHHEVEQGLPELRRRADVIIETLMPPPDIALMVIRWLIANY